MTLFRSKRPSTDEICLNTCNEYQGGEGGDISDSNMSADVVGPYKRANRRRRHRTDSESARLLRDKSADKT